MSSRESFYKGGMDLKIKIIGRRCITISFHPSGLPKIIILKPVEQKKILDIKK